MASQDEARRRVLEIGELLLKQMREEEIPFQEFDVALPEMLKGFTKFKLSPNGKILRELTADEIRLLYIDYAIYHAAQKCSATFVEQGHKHYGELENGMYVPLLRTMSMLFSTYLGMCSDLLEKDVKLTNIDGSLCWVDDPAMNALPEGVEELLQKLKDSGAHVELFEMGPDGPRPFDFERLSSSDPIKEKAKEVMREQRGNKVVYLEPPTSRKQ